MSCLFVVLQSALGIDHPSPQALAALQSKQQHLDKQRHEMQVRTSRVLLSCALSLRA
jgi:hypothetical protein